MGQGFAKAFNDHGLLLGLSDDDHVQYARTDGTRALTGAMDMGGNVITNVGDFTPAADITHDLGSSALSWAEIYVADIYDNVGVRRLDTSLMQFYGNLDPATDNTYDLGDATLTWRALYAHEIRDEGNIVRIDLNLMQFIGHLDPKTNNVYDLGDATLTWRDLYAHNIKDEAGTTRIDINLLRFTGHLDPVTDNTYDLGDSALSWRNIYAYTLSDEAGAQVFDLNLLRAHKHLDPGVDNTYDLGDAALTWRRLYVYDIYDEDGTQRINLQGNLGTLFYNESGTLKFDVGSSWITFHDEIKGSAAWTSTASSAHKAVVWDAANYRIYRFTSRRDMKENIVDMDPALSDKLHDLKLRTFDMKEEFWTGEDGATFADVGQHGLIADEVWDVYGDQAAAPGEDGKPDGWGDRFMTIMLIGEAQQAKKERVAMAARLDAAGL